MGRPREDRLEHPWWWEYALEVIHSGSSVICNPPVTTTDDDYLLLLDPQSYGPFVARLEKEGFSRGGSMPVRKGLIANGFYTLTTDGVKWIEDEKKSNCPLEEFPNLDDPSERDRGKVFESWKLGRLNLILTLSRDYSQNFALATLLSKRLNLLKKEDRITTFEAICFNKWPYQYGVVEKID